jgi:hypothetical protein
MWLEWSEQGGEGRRLKSGHSQGHYHKDCHAPLQKHWLCPGLGRSQQTVLSQGEERAEWAFTGPLSAGAGKGRRVGVVTELVGVGLVAWSSLGH